MIRFELLLVFGSLLACAPDVVQMGRDTYMATSPDYGPGTSSGRLASAVQKANDFCLDKGKEAVVQNTQVTSRPGWHADATVTFICVEPGDPDNVRPHYKAEPDILIEDGNR